MLSNNHFIIRNGRLVPKTSSSSQPQPQQHQTSKLNIIKPSTVIVRHLHNQNKTNNNSQNLEKGASSTNSQEVQQSQLGKIKGYYQKIIWELEDKVRMLEKEGKEKDGVISRMSREIEQIRLKALEEADNIYKLKYSDQKSTARQSHQSSPQTPTLPNQQNLKLNLSLLPKLTPQPQSQPQLQPQSQQLSHSQDDNIITKYKQCNQKCLHNSSQYTIKGNKQYNFNADICNDNQKKCLSREDCCISVSSIYSVSQGSQVGVGILGDMQEVQIQDSHRDRTFFDTSKLMARLNKSASLVRNIKKFLQPTPSSPQIPQQQPQTLPQHQPLSPTTTIHPKLPSQPTQPSQYPTSQPQFQQFITQLLQKHQQIVDMLQNQSIERQEQIKEIHQYYGDVINKLRKDGVCGRSDGRKGREKGFSRVVGSGRRSTKIYEQDAQKQNKVVVIEQILTKSQLRQGQQTQRIPLQQKQQQIINIRQQDHKLTITKLHENNKQTILQNNKASRLTQTNQITPCQTNNI